MSDNREQGEYGLQPELPPGPRWRPVRPIRTQMLEYEREREAPVSVSPRSQFILGMVLPIGYGFLVINLILKLPYPGTALLMALVLFIAGLVYLRIRLQWTALIPGVLLTLLALPLLAVLSCGVIIAALM